MTRAHRRAPGRGVEWEFDKVTFSREYPRGVVTKLLVETRRLGNPETRVVLGIIVLEDLFLAFYLACGVVGGLAQVAAAPESLVPT